MARDTHELKDRAHAARSKGKAKKALELYLELETREPGDGSWAKRAGEMHRQLGDTAAAVDALGRSCDRYAAAGFLVKAIAVCKMILRIAPDDAEARERLVELNAAWATPAGRDSEIAPGPHGEAAPVRPIAAPASRGRAPGAGSQVPGALAQGRPLDQVELRTLVAGSAPVAGAPGAVSGVHDIPIDIPIEVVDDGGIARALARTPLLSSLPRASLAQLIDEVALVELPDGQTLFHEGDVGSALYVVVEGAVAVYREGPPRVRLARLEEGAFFGEVALVTDAPRGATIVAEGDTELLAIDRKLVSALVAAEPGVLRVLLGFLRDRLVDGLVATSPLFAPFAGGDRRALAEKFRFLEVAPGTELVAQGEAAGSLFVVLAGRLAVVRAEGAEARALATLGPGDVFGEMSLLARAGAVASVRADSKVLALAMSAETFREVIMTHPQVLAFVGDLASAREQALAAVEGGGDYEELHLDLF